MRHGAILDFICFARTEHFQARTLDSANVIVCVNYVADVSLDDAGRVLLPSEGLNPLRCSLTATLNGTSAPQSAANSPQVPPRLSFSPTDTREAASRPMTADRNSFSNCSASA